MLTALLLAAAFQTTPAPAPSAPVAAGTAVDPNKKVCRREAQTGSIMAMRKCRTAAEWAQIDASAADQTAEALRQRANAGTTMREFGAGRN